MKKPFWILSVALISFLASCGRTCPTYMKNYDEMDEKETYYASDSVYVEADELIIWK